MARKKQETPAAVESESERTRRVSIFLEPEVEAEFRKILDLDGRAFGVVLGIVAAHVNAQLKGGEIFRLWQADRRRAEQEAGAQLGIMPNPLLEPADGDGRDGPLPAGMTLEQSED